MTWECSFCGKRTNASIPYMVEEGWRKVDIRHWDERSILNHYHLVACPDHTREFCKRNIEYMNGEDFLTGGANVKEEM